MVSLVASQYDNHRKNLKGTIDLGNIKITYDLTEFAKKFQYESNKEYLICKDGKIMMYNLGII